jgi:hypothetical protein
MRQDTGSFSDLFIGLGLCLYILSGLFFVHLIVKAIFPTTEDL